MSDDLDALLDEATEENVLPVDNSSKDDKPVEQKDAQPLYRRKNGKSEQQAENNTPTLNDIIASKLEENNNNNVVNSQEEPVESKEERLARLKRQAREKRQNRIDQRSKKKVSKKFPLTPIYYCDTEGCNNINTTEKLCPICLAFSYCSKECQVKDWEKHKLMCGKVISDENAVKLELYKKAATAAQLIYKKVKDGDYLVVLHDKGHVPAAMFASVADKSNVLNWKEYLSNPIFTTTKTETIGSLSYKVDAALNKFPTYKIFMISVLLDRVRDGATSECVIRLFIADDYSETMNAPTDGKITKTVTKYTRKTK